MSLPKLYLETTIPSYLTARRSRNERLALDQDLTREWWEKERGKYELFVSELVLEEASAGDETMAAARLEALAGMPQLAQTPAVDALAMQIVERGIIPPEVAPDADHIALAPVHAMNFLLTWNCRHIANVFSLRRLEAVCREAGYECPLICTPAILMGI